MGTLRAAAAAAARHFAASAGVTFVIIDWSSSIPADRRLHLIRDRRRRILVELGVYAKSHTPADILYGSDDPDAVML